MPDTVAMVFARRAIDVLRDQPERFQAVLAEAGLTEEALRDPQGRVSAECFGFLWRAVSRSIDDEYFLIDSRRMKCGSFAFLCRGLVHERTLNQALERCLRGFALFLDDVRAELLIDPASAGVRIDAGAVPEAKRVWAFELLFTMIYGIMCWLVGRRVPLVRVDFEFPRPTYVREYRHWLSDALAFDQPTTRICFDPSWLEAPVVANAASLTGFIDSWPQSVFVKYRDLRGWAHRVRTLLKSLPYVDWPEVGELAARFHMSPSSFQRRLGAEGTSYSVIKSEMRRDLAVRLLRDSDTPIQEVASLTGYLEISAFYRAFRQWTGRSPGDYRVGQRIL